MQLWRCFVLVVCFIKFPEWSHCSTRRVILGNEVLRDSKYKGFRDGARIGILTNPTGVFADTMEHIVDNMASKSYLNVVCIFGPEHGFRGEKQAETADSKFYIDANTGIPVFSAYNSSAAELGDVLTELRIDLLLVDMQDVGVRLYTFVWTMFNMLQAVALSSKDSSPAMRVIITDRPNPLGGNLVEGPLLNTSCCLSGYGLFPITHIHGMTIGELGLLFNSQIGIDPQSLTIIKAKNWYRDMAWAAEGMEGQYIATFPPWVPPSPNIPTTKTSMAYGATCFLEATTAAEGRGTNTPFELFGAPFLDATAFSARLNDDFDCSHGNGDGTGSSVLDTGSMLSVEDQRVVETSAFRPTYFQPMWSKYNGTVVPGVQWMVGRTAGWTTDSTARCGEGSGRAKDKEEDGAVDTRIDGPFANGVRILCAIRDLAQPSDDFQWDGSWFGHPGSQLIDEYAGTDSLRMMIDDGWNSDTIIRFYQADTVRFRKTRQPYLLYDTRE